VLIDMSQQRRETVPALLYTAGMASNDDELNGTKAVYTTRPTNIENSSHYASSTNALADNHDIQDNNQEEDNVKMSFLL
jgi:hypothetical protein